MKWLNQSGLKIAKSTIQFQPYHKKEKLWLITKAYLLPKAC